MARRVSFTDSDHTEHAVDVEVESLYEAVALAVVEFREDPLIPSNPSPIADSDRRQWPTLILDVLHMSVP